MNLYIYILQTNTSTSSTTVTIWTIIAAIAAGISAFSAFKSRGFVKRSYELAMKNYSDRQANFNLYLIDAYRWISAGEIKRKFLLFHITIYNKSDSKTSFKAELEIEYLREDNTVARAIISHEEKHKQQIPQEEMSTFSNDIRIEEKSMQSKWLIFEQPTNAFKNYRIEKYCIKLTDTQGNFQSVESTIIKELSNDKEENKS